MLKKKEAMKLRQSDKIKVREDKQSIFDKVNKRKVREEKQSFFDKVNKRQVREERESFFVNALIEQSYSLQN